MPKSPREVQIDLDTARFELNKWETQPKIEVMGVMNGKEEDQIITSIIVKTHKPIYLGPGMKIVVVPE